MKNIKIYEEFGEELFKEITYSETKKFVDNHIPISISDKELLELSSFNLKLYGISDRYVRLRQNNEHSSNYISDLYKFEDEWYIIIFSNTKRTHSGIFLCDTFGGLIECIKLINKYNEKY